MAPVGYTWLIREYGLRLPRPHRTAAIGGKNRIRREGARAIYPEQYAPSPDLAGHLTFALKYEGLNLAVLHALYATVEAREIVHFVRQSPTGEQARRAWFLYEWLTGTSLDLPDAPKVKAVNAVNEELQFALADAGISTRHRVRDNMPGVPAFCPMVWRTDQLAAPSTDELSAQAATIMGGVRQDVLARAAAFLLLSDSKASFGIEGETPSPDRAQRWAHATARAGSAPLTIERFVELQRQVIGDARFVPIGLRQEGGFVGEHDRMSGRPLPEHISARWEDLPTLLQGIVDYQARTTGRLDAVVAAAAAAFGFVYIHPFVDGNGRVHRWLLHHVLAASGFTPRDIIFPVSAVMFRNIDAYRRVLESYSRPLLECIEWQPTEGNNVAVLNETAPWYRYFDATAHAEFLHECVRRAVAEDLPHEVAYLRAYDGFLEDVQSIVDMPASKLDLLHRFLRQNGGTLSRRARDKEFAALTDAEVARIERALAERMADVPPEPGVHTPGQPITAPQ